MFSSQGEEEWRQLGLEPEEPKDYGFWRIRETLVSLNLGSSFYQLCGPREINH